MSNLIYMHTSPSGRSYIGKTNKTLEGRWQQHCASANRRCSGALYDAIRKYGAESFIPEVIVKDIPDCMIDTFEKYWIDYYGTYESGYDLTIGGDGASGAVRSAETRELISKSKIRVPREDLKGEGNPMASPEARKKVSEATRRGKHYRATQVHTPDSVFECFKDAGDFYGITREGVRVRCNSNNPKYVDYYTIANPI